MNVIVDEMKAIRSQASSHRSAIFKALLTLPHDDKYLAYLVTQKAKELGLIESDRKKLKGKTVIEWSQSREVDGRNTPNAWACTAAIHLLIDYNVKLPLSEQEVAAFSYYLSPSIDRDVFNQSKALVTNSLLKTH